MFRESLFSVQYSKIRFRYPRVCLEARNLSAHGLPTNLLVLVLIWQIVNTSVMDALLSF